MFKIIRGCKNLIFALRYFIKKCIVRAKNKNSVDTYLKKILGSVEFKNDHSFNKKIESKMYTFAQFLPITLGSLFSEIHNLKTTENQKKALIVLGSLAAVSDTLFDESKHKINITLNSKPSKKLSDIENVICILYQELLYLLPPKKNKIFYKKLNELYRTQLDSLLQKKKSISNSEIVTLTKKKGVATTLYYLIINPHASKKEIDIITELGAYLQLYDDICDIDHDSIDQIQTIATKNSDPRYLLDLFYDWRKKTYQKLDSMGALEDILFTMFIWTIMGECRLRYAIRNNEKYEFSSQFKKRYPYWYACYLIYNYES